MVRGDGVARAGSKLKPDQMKPVSIWDACLPGVFSPIPLKAQKNCLIYKQKELKSEFKLSLIEKEEGLSGLSLPNALLLSSSELWHRSCCR